MRNNKGFSLVELIVVIAIMAILAAVAIPTFAGFIGKANDAADVGFINDVEYSAQLAQAAAPDPDADLTVIVTLDANKNAATVYVGDVAIPKTLPNDASDFVKDVHATIDWKYTFKSVDANGTYGLNATGKALETKSAP